MLTPTPIEILNDRHRKTNPLPLDRIDTVLNFARTMTWKGNNPVVKLVTEVYKTGVKLTKQAIQFEFFAMSKFRQ
jgi:hypothetical protein